MMLKKVTLRAVSVVILTLLLIIFVDFQLRTKHLNNVIHFSTRIEHSIQNSLTPVKNTQSAASSPQLVDANRLNRTGTLLQGRVLKWKNRLRATQPALKLTDIFIAVKTTGKFHGTRLSLLLDTWIDKTKEHTFIFTDREDEDIAARGFKVVVTDCPSDHSHQALSCKMSSEYDHFMASDKRWLCHVDDDNYVNPGALLSLLAGFPAQGDVYVGKPSLDHPITAHELLEDNSTREVRFWFATGGAGFCLSRQLAEKMSPWASGRRFEQTSSLIRLPDDCTVGFIVEQRLRIPLVHCPLFHSHLENLLLLTLHNIPLQVTLGYGLFENKMISVALKGSFSQEEDPSRFKTLHCLLYPFTSWCP